LEIELRSVPEKKKYKMGTCIRKLNWNKKQLNICILSSFVDIGVCAHVL